MMLPSKQLDGKYFHNKLSTGGQQKQTNSHEGDDDVQKKRMHRELERQRRQEMTTHYAFLTSLLPLEYIKGKRSISDHMNEAVTYIKHLQNKIKELSAQRDKLKKFSNLNVVDPEIRTSSSSTAADPPTNVSVHQCLNGLEIVLIKSIKEQRIPLSRILVMLLEDNLTADNCVYTKVEQRLMIYTIHLQIPDPTSFEPSALQRKLSEAISSSSYSSF